MKTEIRIDPDGRERRVIIFQEGDFGNLKNELLDRKYTITIWLEAAVFRSGDVVVNNRTQEECIGLCGRFELLEEIDQKWLKRNGVWGYYQKWTARKFRERLRKIKEGTGGEGKD